MSTLVNEAKNKFLVVSRLFRVLLKGLGAGRASQFCTKTKFTHAFSSVVIASVPGCRCSR